MALPAGLRRRWHRHPVLRFALLVALLGSFGLLLLLAPPDLQAIPDAVDRLGPFAPLAAVGVGAALLIVLVPRTLITVAWGALFGPLGGAGYTLAAALLAALLGFGVGRWLGRDFVAERVRGRLARLDGWFSRQSLFGVITVRLLPIGGFGLVSYGYGTTGARLLPYLAGSVIASAPSAFGYAAIGSAVVSPGSINWFAVAPATFGLFATAIILWRWRRSARPPTRTRPDR
ncbi:VTT domain-containing protein [Asanoa sp. WMMD1127]|uniref:TVP38/TMEM64 family protein n=1 Tax=Asanoa sp. WMMD1127 TaxID=3016107 RepID=UPI00241777D6|nr:VTT domain-containing protein [Asanoa sp. WMMD1127]MDG4827085.1 VTT domain-containing protein [Asanoa sp. WMMD1127]